MRDRSGNTPLAAATARGFRAVVKVLLNEGANIHNRNYAGFGILTQASRWKRSAKMEKNDKLHAGIWSSVLLLIDNGAKHDPTALDEWMSTDGKEEFSRRVSSMRTGLGSAPISISKRAL
jgi:ankyrin repeat protein